MNNSDNNKALVPNIIEGIIRSASVEDFISQEDSTQETINMHFDRVGAITVRPGITAYTDAVLSDSPVMMTQWNEAGTNNRKLITQIGNELKALESGTFNTIRTMGTSNRVRASQMNNTTFFVSGNNGDNPGSYNGSTYTNGVASLPKGDYVNSGFEKRVWVGDKKTGKVYYTDQIPFGDPVTGGSEYIYFNAEHGQAMTGLEQAQKALLVFYPDCIFRIYGATSSDPYPAYYVGTYSQESIVKGKDSIYFHHSSGFYRFKYEGQPQEISRRIIDIVQAIPRDNYDNVFGWSDDDHIYWHVGDLEIEGVKFKNTVLRYTISSDVWTIYCYFSSAYSERKINCAFVYDDGFNLNRLLGISDGIIGAMNTGTTDLDEDIYYENTSRWISFSQEQSDLQEFKGLAVMALNAGGAQIKAQSDKDLPSKWQYIGTYDEDYVTVFRSVSEDFSPFNRVRFKINGTSNGTAPIFGTIEVLDYNIVGKKYN